MEKYVPSSHGTTPLDKDLVLIDLDGWTKQALQGHVWHYMFSSFDSCHYICKCINVIAQFTYWCV